MSCAFLSSAARTAVGISAVMRFLPLRRCSLLAMQLICRDGSIEMMLTDMRLDQRRYESIDRLVARDPIAHLRRRDVGGCRFEQEYRGRAHGGRVFGPDHARA